MDENTRTFLTPDEIVQRTFPKVKKGGVDEWAVNQFLADIANDYNAISKQNAAFQQELMTLGAGYEGLRAKLEELERQGSPDQARMEAQRIIDEANRQRDSILAEAEASYNDAKERQSQQERLFNNADQQAATTISKAEQTAAETIANAEQTANDKIRAAEEYVDNIRRQAQSQLEEMARKASESERTANEAEARYNDVLTKKQQAETDLRAAEGNIRRLTTEFDTKRREGLASLQEEFDTKRADLERELAGLRANAMKQAESEIAEQKAANERKLEQQLKEAEERYNSRIADMTTRSTAFTQEIMSKIAQINSEVNHLQTLTSNPDIGATRQTIATESSKPIAHEASDDARPKPVNRDAITKQAGKVTPSPARYEGTEPPTDSAIQSALDHARAIRPEQSDKPKEGFSSPFVGNNETSAKTGSDFRASMDKYFAQLNELGRDVPNNSETNPAPAHTEVEHTPTPTTSMPFTPASEPILENREGLTSAEIPVDTSHKSPNDLKATNTIGVEPHDSATTDETDHETRKGHIQSPLSSAKKKGTWQTGGKSSKSPKPSRKRHPTSVGADVEAMFE